MIVRRKGVPYRVTHVLSSARTVLESLALACAIAATCVSARAANSSADAVVKEQLITNTQKLLDAIAPGDKAPWAKAMAEECLYSDENGTTMTKAKFLEELGPLPAGYSGNIKLEKPQFVLAGDTAILAYEMNEQETVFGQELHARYHATDTWVRRDGQWHMIASQVVRHGGDPPAASLTHDLLKEYVGVYEMAPGVQYTVTVDGGQVWRERRGRKKEALMPEMKDVFFRKGATGRRIFERAADGKVVRMIDRRDGEDLVWKRVE
jgi:hypothetical protein